MEEMALALLVVGLTICVGSLFPLFPNDSSLWLPVKYNGITTNKVWKNIVAGKAIAIAAALEITLILDMFVGILPKL